MGPFLRVVLMTRADAVFIRNSFHQKSTSFLFRSHHKNTKRNNVGSPVIPWLPLFFGSRLPDKVTNPKKVPLFWSGTLVLIWLLGNQWDSLLSRLYGLSEELVTWTLHKISECRTTSSEAYGGLTWKCEKLDSMCLNHSIGCMTCNCPTRFGGFRK